MVGGTPPREMHRAAFGRISPPRAAADVYGRRMVEPGREASDLHAALRALAGGGEAIVQGDRRIRVEYATDSDGDVTGLALVCRYDAVATARVASGYRDAGALRAVRPLELRLETERDGHARARREGLVREWQSGDPAFDDRVFVNTPTTDPAVLSAVLGPAAREAVLALLDLGFEPIGIDVAGEVRASLPAQEFTRDRGPDGAARAAAAIDAFLRLTAQLPIVTASGEAHPRRPLAGVTLALQAVGLVGWLGNIPFVAGTHYALCRVFGVSVQARASTASLAASVALGIVGGLLGAKGYAALVAARARGRADALDLSTTARLAGFGGCSVLTFVAARAVATAAGW